MSLRVKFLLPLIAVLVLCFSLIGFMSFSTTRNVADQIVESQMTDIADSIGHQIESSAEVTKTALRMMDEKNLSLANAVAAMIAEDPKYLELAEMDKLVALLGVDEVHVTDENGVLLWGNVPDFYGLDFASTEQTAALLPILKDGKPIAQEPMPRGSDGVMFQYINVSRVDQKGIVQVGVSMASIDEINSTMSVQNAIQGTKIGDTGGVFVLDANSTVTADSTSTMLGEDMSTQSWVAAATTQGDGRFTYTMDGIDYDAYHRQLGDQTIVAYMPKAETDSYATEALAVILPIGVGAAVVVLIIAIILIQWMVNKTEWYEHILDTVPMPLSVTDNHRRWTFVNRAVEAMVGKKRKELLGQPCSNWNSVLCGTDQCGLDCLQKGISTTTYHENDLDIKVDAASLVDHHHHTIGHVELMQDVSHIFKAQRASATLVSNISEVSESFVAVSRQIAEGAQTLAQGSTEQASAVQELSASISEIAQKTRANAEMASRASHLANTIRDSAERGSAQMSEMTHAVGEINEASHNIRKVMGAIEQIAFQTNILALNASVEAARAGQHGRGFAVVAEEVRTLAAKSDEAAKETGGLITNSIDKAELGARIADETASSLTEIVRGIIESAQIVGEIASSSEEQATGIAQVNVGVDQVAQVVQKNSATAEESAAAADTMSSKSAELEDLITAFKNDEHQAEELAKQAMERESASIAAEDGQNRGIGKY